jgi:hypothetical protein
MSDNAPKLDQLPIPEMAFEDSEGFEVLRAWIAAGDLHCSLKIGLYPDDGDFVEEDAWGVILADAAMQIANAIASRRKGDFTAVLRRIEEGLLDRMANPPEEISGRFLSEH